MCTAQTAGVRVGIQTLLRGTRRNSDPTRSKQESGIFKFVHLAIGGIQHLVHGFAVMPFCHSDA